MEAAVIRGGIVALLTGLLLITLAIPVALSHVRDPRDCDTGKSPHQAGANVNPSSDYKFRWETSAGRLGERWCYDRLIRNEHHSKPLAYDWPATGLSAPYGLLAQGEGHSNFDTAEGPPTGQKAHLLYGLGKGRIAQTVVFLAPSETTRHSANARIGMRVFDSAGAVVDINLSVRTAVSAAAIWGYRYDFQNSGDPIRLIWTPIRVSAFIEMASQKVPGWTSGEPLPLRSKDALRVEFELQKKPRFIIAQLSLVDSAGRIIGTATAPTYVPFP